MSKIPEQRDLGNEHGRSGAIILFPQSLPYKGLQRSLYLGNERGKENENYESVAPSGICKMTTSQGNNILFYFISRS